MIVWRSVVRSKSKSMMPEHPPDILFGWHQWHAIVGLSVVRELTEFHPGQSKLGR
jgi:hypothetical protein